MNFATLQDSVFLQALGNAILNSLWQGFIIWIVYETINVSYKNASSAFKNKLSTVFIFISFGWFLASFIRGFYIDENLPAVSLSPASIAIAESTKENLFNVHNFLSYATGSLPYLSVSYIFLLFFLMFKLFSSYRYVYFIANRRLVSPPFELQYFTSKVAEQLNITKRISVWISNYIDVPATIGFLKPVILIPVASINSLSSHQLEAIILHELSHIKRNDYVINLFISVVETILFFNPFVSLLAKTIKRERENCCDDFVIQYRYDPHSYATALLRLEQSRRSNLQLVIGAVSGKKQLLTRIKRITNGKVVSKQFNYGQKILALLFVTFIICSIAWLSPQETKKNIYKKEVTKDSKTPIEFHSQDQIIPEELVNIETQPGEIKTRKEDVHSNRKLSILQPGLLHESKNEFDLINEIENLDKNKFAEQGNKEFYFNDANNNNTPGLFFDQNVFKDMPLKLLEDYSFQNLNIHIDINELNKNLKEAYKGIKAMDWGKIQADINESLSKIKPNQLSSQEMSKFFEENSKHLFAIRNQTEENSKILRSGLRKKVFLFDSLRNIEIGRVSRPLHKVERLIKVKSANTFQEEGDNFSNDNFDIAPLPKEDFNKTIKNNISKVISISGLKNKNALIILNNLTRAYKESKDSFHYSISSNSINKTNQQKSIRIEVNEVP